MRRPIIYTCINLCMLAAVAGIGRAQSGTGQIAGQVLDAGSGTPLSAASVQISGTTVGTNTDIDGRYSIARVPSGSASITVRRIGFAPKTITGISVTDRGVTEQNVTLQAATVRLTTQVVTASAERGTVSDALDKQRSAIGIVNSITSEQIARSPDGNAAQAVGRVSGVTVQDGRYISVRGLGERYTTTTLNGARIPSPEPERRVVPLDIFPSALLQSVTTSKTFTPDQPGDFSGAQVDLQTREFPLRRVVTYTTAAGVNATAAGQVVPTAPTVGGEWLGFGGGARELPGIVKVNGNFNSASQATVNQAIRSLRNTWTPQTTTGTPNYSGTVSVGSQALVKGHNVGYVASGSYNYTQGIQDHASRSLAVPDGKGGTRPYNSFAGTTASEGVLWGGLFNLSTLVGQKTRLALNNTYNRSADNIAATEFGTRDDFSYPTRRSLLDFVSRTVRSNQLRLERAIGDRQDVKLSLTSSGVSRNEPDRTEVQYVRETDASTNKVLPFALFSYNPDGARKTYATLDERNVSGTLDYRLGILKIGGALRSTHRNTDNTSYSLLSVSLPRSVREQPLEAILSGPYVQDSSRAFTLQQNSTGGTYTANDNVSAGYAMAEFNVGDHVRLTGGVRAEHDNLVVRSFGTTGDRNTARLNTTDLLPAAVVTVALSETQNLRLSASRTLSRPEYRELSPIQYRDVIAQRDIFGNASLKRALIQNYDVRWEWYPGSGEILSFGAFGKRFTDPIERVDVATSGASQLSFVNADAATDFGAELDMRVNMGRFGSVLRPFTAFTNATVMKSRIDITSDRLSALTNGVRPLVGQAPYVVNGGITYTSSSGHAVGTVLYNVVGKRITAAGVTPLPDTYEQPRGALDVSLQLPLFAAVSARVDARNLINAAFEERQGDVIRERYFTGRVFSVGLRWQP